MSDVDLKCSICPGNFPSSALKDGKCPDCQKNYPTAKDYEDAVRLAQPKNLELNKKMDEKTVREIVRDEITKVIAEAEKKEDK